MGALEVPVIEVAVTIAVVLMVGGTVLGGLLLGINALRSRFSR